MQSSTGCVFNRLWRSAYLAVVAESYSSRQALATHFEAGLRSPSRFLRACVHSLDKHWHHRPREFWEGWADPVKVIIGRHASLEVLQMALVLGFVYDESVLKGCALSGDFQKCQTVAPSSKSVRNETLAAAINSGSLETVRLFIEERGAEAGTYCMELAANRGFAPVVQYLHARQTDDVHDWQEALMSGAAAGAYGDIQCDILEWVMSQGCQSRDSTRMWYDEKEAADYGQQSWGAGLTIHELHIMS